MHLPEMGDVAEFDHVVGYTAVVACYCVKVTTRSYFLEKVISYSYCRKGLINY